MFQFVYGVRDFMFFICLFQLIDLFNYYVVIVLFFIGKDISVEVFFLDYGNGEFRKFFYFRKLLQKYVSLFVQGILCVLFQVCKGNYDFGYVKGIFLIKLNRINQFLF